MNSSSVEAAQAPTAPSRVSDELLRQFAGYQLKRAFNIIRAELTAGLEPLGLRIITYSALSLVVENPGLRQSQVASALGIERPNLVVIIDELEQHGLIVRERVPTDRRAYALKATLKGQRTCEKAIAMNRAQEDSLFSRLAPEDRAALRRVLEAIERPAESARQI